MDKTTLGRLPKVVLATALFVAISLNSPPGTPSVPEDRPPPPRPEEVRVLEELAEWVLGTPLSRGSSGLLEPDLTSAVRARRQSFELFRRYSGEQARRELVRRLPYGDLILASASRHRLDGLLLAAIVESESGFDPQAVSHQGAMGLMQIMPATAELYSVEDLLDPSRNIDTGARYFAYLLREFDGDVALALAAYNAGPGNVARHDGVPPFEETREYVARVLDRYVGYHQRLWETSGASFWLF